MARVLIVEDEALIAFDIETIITTETGAACVVVHSVSAARRELKVDFDFVFLDVNVADGTTFELARELSSNSVPFAFVTGSYRAIIPADLHGAVFLTKPFTARKVASVLLSGLTASSRGREGGTR